MQRDPLYGIRLKLDRAHQQLQALERDFGALFTEGKPYRVSPNYNVAKRELTLVAHVDRAAPGTWGVQIGEIVHNLRSALDHLIWELVVHHTGSPPREGTKSQFPIFKTETGYKKRTPEWLGDVAPDASARIKSLQPFATGEGERSPLWRLHELSNFDKHRTLHVTGAVLEGGQIKFSGLKPHTPCNIVARIPGPFIDNAVLLTMTFPGTDWPFPVPPGHRCLQAK